VPSVKKLRAWITGNRVDAVKSPLFTNDVIVCQPVASDSACSADQSDEAIDTTAKLRRHLWMFVAEGLFVLFCDFLRKFSLFTEICSAQQCLAQL